MQSNARLANAFCRGHCHGRADFCEHWGDASLAQALPMGVGTVARSPWTICGLCRGRPCLPRMCGMASTSASSCVMSCVFAAVRMTASGMPCASTMRWCLLPSLRRSVGFGPVFFPPARRESMSCRRAHARNRFRHGAVRRATFRGCVARHPPLATRRAVASKLCPNRIPFPVAGGSTQCPSATRTLCPLARLGRVSVCGPRIGDCVVLARATVAR